MKKQWIFWLFLLGIGCCTNNHLQAQQPPAKQKKATQYEGAVIGNSDKTVVQQNQEQIEQASDVARRAEGDGRISAAEVAVLNKIRKEKAAAKY